MTVGGDAGGAGGASPAPTKRGESGVQPPHSKGGGKPALRNTRAAFATDERAVASGERREKREIRRCARNDRFGVMREGGAGGGQPPDGPSEERAPLAGRRGLREGEGVEVGGRRMST